MSGPELCEPLAHPLGLGVVALELDRIGAVAFPELPYEHEAREAEHELVQLVTNAVHGGDH